MCAISSRARSARSSGCVRVRASFATVSSSMFPDELLQQAAKALDLAKAGNVRIATAETCTAGLGSSCLTSVPGASKVFERGFVLYHDSAKATGLGVPESIARTHGAVSAEVTKGRAG